ncbi:MAG: HAD family hydrolase [Phycisphaeraceae bacterium]
MKKLALILTMIVFQGCTSVDPLPSWNDTAAKHTILDFVHAVTDPASTSYVAPDQRIATFDNDGTLWCEKPNYPQVVFVVARLRALAQETLDLRAEQPYKAAWDKDYAYFRNLNTRALLTIVLQAHTGMSQDEFSEQARAFLGTARHPRFGKPYTQTVYQPMLELIEYLSANEFKVYICTAGGMGFVRTFSQQAYGIPPENVIGSSAELEFQMHHGQPVLIRKPALVEPMNNREGKPVNIRLHIGRRPILAVGNSTGDLAMLQFAKSPHRPSLRLLLHHDDDKREYAYDQGARKAQQVAKERGWTIVSMKEDFKTVFAFEARE